MTRIHDTRGRSAADPLATPAGSAADVTPSPITHRLGPDAFLVTSPAAAVAWLRRLGWVKVRRASKQEYARLSLLRSTASITPNGLVTITHRRAA